MNPLDVITASDLMETEVLSFLPGDSVEQAILELEESGHAGAPVVDAGGRVRGVFSLSDAARLEASVAGDILRSRGERVLLRNAAGEESLEERQQDELLEMGEYNSGVPTGPTVGEWMTSEIVSVAPDAPLARVCATMQEHQVHRVLVLERGRLRGIVSSMDVVACLAEQA